MKDAPRSAQFEAPLWPEMPIIFDFVNKLVPFCVQKADDGPLSEAERAGQA
jgi:hypothetical protein